MVKDNVDTREVQVFVRITTRYIIKYTDKLLSLLDVYCEIVIAYWSRHITKLARNREEMAHLSIFICMCCLFFYLLTYYINKLRRYTSSKLLFLA